MSIQKYHYINREEYISVVWYYSKCVHYILQSYRFMIIAETYLKQTNVTSDGVTIIDSNLDLLSHISVFDGYACQKDKGMSNLFDEKGYM